MVLAEIMFFIVPFMMLGFGFVNKPVLITQGDFCYWWTVFTQHQALSVSHIAVLMLPASALRVQKKLGEDTARNPTDPRDISEHTASCSATKAKGRAKEEGWKTFRVKVIVFPSNYYAWGSPAFLEMANSCLPKGYKEWIPYFAFLVHTAVALPLKLSFISTHDWDWWAPLIPISRVAVPQQK